MESPATRFLIDSRIPAFQQDTPHTRISQEQERAALGKRVRLLGYTPDLGLELGYGQQCRTPEEFERGMSNANVDDYEFDELCDAQDHLGETCTIEAVYDDGPRNSFAIRFDDGCLLIVIAQDISVE